MSNSALTPDDFCLILARSPKFVDKAAPAKQRICEALHILHNLGVPLESTPRRLERVGMVFAAVAGVRADADWSLAEDEQSGRSMKTRNIISYINSHFGEDISPGSYDDIRRKDLALIHAAGIVVGTKLGSAQNDSRRGYALDPGYAEVIRHYQDAGWNEQARVFLSGRKSAADVLAGNRALPRSMVTLPSGTLLSFSPGEHNELQKALIEEFLPRYGYGAEVLYVGDANARSLVNRAAKLEELGFFELSHAELPDIVAYSSLKNWLYVIEAVWSSGPIHALRKLKLDKLLTDVKAPVVYVTAFLTKKNFRKYAAEIAWETEVWIAEEPEHMIHFNGPKIVRPYQPEKKDPRADETTSHRREDAPD